MQGRKGHISAYRLQPVIEGSQGESTTRNLKQKSWRSTACWLPLSGSCLANFLLQPMTTCPWNMVGWALLAINDLTNIFVISNGWTGRPGEPRMTWFDLQAWHWLEVWAQSRLSFWSSWVISSVMVLGESYFLSGSSGLLERKFKETQKTASRGKYLTYF